VTPGVCRRSRPDSGLRSELPPAEPAAWAGDDLAGDVLGQLFHEERLADHGPRRSPPRKSSGEARHCARPSAAGSRVDESRSMSAEISFSAPPQRQAGSPWPTPCHPGGARRPSPHFGRRSLPGRPGCLRDSVMDERLMSGPPRGGFQTPVSSAACFSLRRSTDHERTHRLADDPWVRADPSCGHGTTPRRAENSATLEMIRPAAGAPARRAPRRKLGVAARIEGDRLTKPNRQPIDLSRTSRATAGRRSWERNVSSVSGTGAGACESTSTRHTARPSPLLGAGGFCGTVDWSRSDPARRRGDADDRAP